jgi:hypothetical protein
MRSEKRDNREIYCHWHSGYVLPAPHVRESFADGKTMCLECQVKMANNLVAAHVTWPELSMVERIKIINQRPDAPNRAPVTTWDEPQTTRDGWIYYVRQGELIKIGYTSNLAKRLKSYAPTGVLLAVHPGTRATEKEMHQKFAASLDQGREWFRPRPELMRHIEETRSRYGAPDAHQPSLRKHRRAGEDQPKDRYVTRL